jgi:hypothetical protein
MLSANSIDYRSWIIFIIHKERVIFVITLWHSLVRIERK